MDSGLTNGGNRNWQENNIETLERLLELMDLEGGTTEPITRVSEYVEFVRQTSQRWQERDLRERDRDPKYTLNDARIVGQVWFRGQRDCE